MLEEIVFMFLSFFSLVTSETPPLNRVFSRGEANETPNAEGFIQNEDEKWQPYINKEYEESSDEALLLDGSLTVYGSYASLDRGQPERRSVWASIRRSITTSLTVTFAVIPLTVFTMAFLYLDLNTTDLCVEWQFHNNTLPFSVKRLRVIGDSVEAIITNLWFPLTTLVLFGWKVFKLRFMPTFYVALVFGETIIIYYLFLLSFGVYDTQLYYRFPANFLFLAGIVACSFVVVCNIRVSRDSPLTYSNGHIFTMVCTEFLVCSMLAFVYRYLIVPFFNQFKEENYKFMVAAIAPALTVFPAIVCKHIALRRSSEVVHPGRSFVLVYFIRGGVIYLYRTMQADFKNIWLFIGLSLFSGVLNFLKTATLRIRIRIWKSMISFLNRTVCCRTLNELPCNTPHFRRLKADLEIQDMLFEYSTLILSQGYFVLFFVESFELSAPSIFCESLRRVAIGIGIDLFFNCLSNFVQIHYYNVPIGRVWARYWKRHMLANLIIVMVIVSYFSPVLLSVFQARVNDTEASKGNFVVKNCTWF